MTTFNYFKTYSYGGATGRKATERTFETIAEAKENALQDTWNECFTLYEVTAEYEGDFKKAYITGKIKTTEKLIGELACQRDLAYIKSLEEEVIKYKKDYEKQLNNTNIQEATKKRRLEKIQEEIDWRETTINRIKQEKNI